MVPPILILKRIRLACREAMLLLLLDARGKVSQLLNCSNKYNNCYLQMLQNIAGTFMLYVAL